MKILSKHIMLAGNEIHFIEYNNKTIENGFSLQVVRFNLNQALNE